MANKNSGPVPEENQSLPVILPMVIYHGKEKWNISKHFQDLFPKGLESSLKYYIPSWEYQIYDLSHFDDEMIKSKVKDKILQNVMFVLRDVKLEDTEVMYKHIASATKASSKLDEQNQATKYLMTLMTYLWNVRDDLPGEKVKQVIEKIDPERSEEIMTIADRLRKEGELRGKAEGRKEGEAEILIKLLTKRFGPLQETLKTHIRQTDETVIEIALDNILDYENLEEVKKDIYLVS